MDLGTVVGICVGLGLVFAAIISGGGLLLFLDVPSLMIVLGGVVATLLISFPLPVIKNVISVVARAFSSKTPSPTVILDLIIHYAEVARRDGMLALEEESEKAPDEFLKKALRLAVDGTDADLIGMILRLELKALMTRHKQGADILKQGAEFAPAFGMIGTLIGLIQMLQVLDDPSAIGGGMAVALVTSFWGAFLANTIFLPLANKLKNRSAEEQAIRRLIIEGVTSIQGGDSPRIVKEKLHTFLPPSQRVEEKVEA
ncbi:MAG: flagellar motor protein MotP [Gemmatimonadota bacterium]|nr:MAG: flagellar motor protein MotP [Gemmatimonadota bacterium]